MPQSMFYNFNIVFLCFLSYWKHCRSRSREREVRLDAEEDRRKLKDDRDRDREKKRGGSELLRESKKVKEIDRDREHGYYNRDDRPGYHRSQIDRNNRRDVPSDPRRRDEVQRKHVESRDSQRRRSSRSRSPLGKLSIDGYWEIHLEHIKIVKFSCNYLIIIVELMFRVIKIIVSKTMQCNKLYYRNFSY